MPYMQLVLEALRKQRMLAIRQLLRPLGPRLRTYARTPARSFRAHTNPWEVSNVSCPP